MKLEYTLLDPSKNMTVLVSTPLPAAQQPAAAAHIMSVEPTAEQVGFLSGGGECDIALRMAGGEFCGNATMSAAVLFCEENGISEGEVTVCISGSSKPLTVAVRRTGNAYRGTVEMPKPREMRLVPLPMGEDDFSLPVVFFEGIAHIISQQPMDKQTAESAVKRWCELLKTDALGLMLLDREICKITPLVYVPAADTIFWEQSCASGTAAVGAWLAKECGAAVDLCFTEPGSALSIYAAPDMTLRLTGTVNIVSKNSIEI